MIYAFATENGSGLPFLRQGKNPLLQKTSTFATVRRDVFLQAGYGHGHFIRQGPLLGAREFPQVKQVTHAITGLLELAFEPSMLWAADSIGRRRAHQAPVENVEEQCSR